MTGLAGEEEEEEDEDWESEQEELSEDNEFDLSASDDAEDSDEEDEDEDEDDEDDGITEEGMQRLMKALGKDGLDAFDLAQLNGEDDDDEDDEDDEDEEEEEEEEDMGSEEEDDEDEDMDADDLPAVSFLTVLVRYRMSMTLVTARTLTSPPHIVTQSSSKPLTTEALLPDELPLDELDSDLSVDEDVVPKRKVVHNNRVRTGLQMYRDSTSGVSADTSLS